MSDQVIQALEDQVGCYRRLAKLAELQHTHVQQDNTDALMSVLGKRQQMMEQISQLESQIAPAKEDWPGYFGRIGAELRSRAESLLLEKRQLLAEITSADQDDAMVLQQKKLNVGRQMNQAAAARHVNRNYAAAAYGQRPSRMDMHK